MKRIILSLLLCGAAALLAVGCGDDDSGTSPCVEAGSAICSKACACTEGDACALQTSGGVTMSFDVASDCRGFMVTLGCSGGGSDKIDYPACTAAVEAAECVDATHDSETIQALAFPAECDEPDEEEGE